MKTYQVSRMNQGFTLVELLVTTAIIGILASMAISSFSTYRRVANDTVALSQLRSLMTASEAFTADHPDIPVDLPYGVGIGNRDDSHSISVSFTADGASIFGGYSTNELLPGFVNNPDVIFVSFLGRNIYGRPPEDHRLEYGFLTYHCDGTRSTEYSDFVMGYEYSTMSVYYKKLHRYIAFDYSDTCTSVYR